MRRTGWRSRWRRRPKWAGVGSADGRCPRRRSAAMRGSGPARPGRAGAAAGAGRGVDRLRADAAALTAHALGREWGPAWGLGAVVSPTDATAVGILARALPRRIVTVLRP